MNKKEKKKVLGEVSVMCHRLDVYTRDFEQYGELLEIPKKQRDAIYYGVLVTTLYHLRETYLLMSEERKVDDWTFMNVKKVAREEVYDITRISRKRIMVLVKVSNLKFEGEFDWWD
jgi:hypothetical protein